MIIEDRINSFNELCISTDMYIESWGVNNECINKLVMEYEDLENDFNNDYYTESSTDKTGLLNKMISKLKELVKKVSSYVSKLIKSSTSKVKDLSEKIPISKKVWNGIKKFFEIVKKFLTAPLNFIKKHKKGSTAIAILTGGGLVITGLVISNKKRKDMKSDLGVISRSEVKSQLKVTTGLIDDCDKSISYIENEIKDIDKEMTILSNDIKAGTKVKTRKGSYIAVDKSNGTRYYPSYSIMRQDMTKLKNEKESKLNEIDEKKKNRENLVRDKERASKWDISTLQYAMNLLKQILVNLKKTATTLSKA